MSPRMFLFVSLLTPLVASGASAATCPSSGYTASSGALSLTSNCTVTGNISLSGTATMTMTGATLTVAGNVTLAGSSALTVTNGELAFPQHSFNQYAINLSNNSQMTIDNSTVSTNLTGANQFTVTLTASNSATLTVTNSSLLANSHILGNFNNTSTLIESGSTDVPTEVYPTSQAKVTISGGTFGTLWLDYGPGTPARSIFRSSQFRASSASIRHRLRVVYRHHIEHRRPRSHLKARIPRHHQRQWIEHPFQSAILQGRLLAGEQHKQYFH